MTLRALIPTLRGRYCAAMPRRGWSSLALVSGVLAAGLLLLGIDAFRHREAPPSEPEDLCSIFAEKRHWHRSARRSFERWGVPVTMQLAIVYQESRFIQRSRPPRKKLLWLLPGPPQSSAYGYAQVLDRTWNEYRQAQGRGRARRHDFGDVTDFIGWYRQEITKRTGLSSDDAYRFYLAYHEGIAGFRRGSYSEKPWLHDVARQFAARVQRYEGQYAECARTPQPRFLILLGAVAVLMALSWLLCRRMIRTHTRARSVSE